MSVSTRLGKREGQYKDIIKIAAVNFHALWGEKENNIKTILDYVDKAAEKGCDLVVFPEMCVTGYDNVHTETKKEKMQVRMAETIPGKTTEKFIEKAKEKKIYIIAGMPEKEDILSDTVYNTAVVIGPEGYVGKYRKTHIPFDESEWSTPGENIEVIDTPWGPIGIVICYDIYAFPEIARIYAGYGARILVNLTGHTIGARVPDCETEIEDTSITNGLFVVTASLAGPGLAEIYSGGSSIVGLDEDQVHAKYYAGYPFYSEEGRSVGMVYAELDLSKVDTNYRLPLYRTNPYTNKPDFTPERYARWYKELSDSAEWKEKL